eukprot:TRINITY_DN18651_c0_g1_i1.p1 TRINITY_DN18651_c0_g1~~TRINITY_DN18651_c0_g1_i1.p1  ORF type:complete len:600 (-),score=110.92 TRINITY_DN18651_c0_g1_i1:181-1980(-)
MSSAKTNMDKKLLEDQLSDLMSMIESSEHHADGAQPVQIISPLERLLKTKPIWFLPQVTREESSKLLHNKKPGNFIIRGSRQPKTLAISVKIGKKQSDQVQHFIIIQSERKVSLEDSDIKFDNVVSLAFHYSNICDELPEKLSLPNVLASAGSIQNLVSLSLLGKSFWTYPMARSDRTSLFVMDNEAFNLSSHLDQESQSSILTTQSDNQTKHLSQSEPICHQGSNRFSYQKQQHDSCLENTKLVKTPPIHPRKSSLGSMSTSPLAKVKTRRNSDSVSFITSPARAPCVSRNSIANMSNVRKPDPSAKEGEDWVTSPVFADSLTRSRNRKVSVFDGSLGSVKEIQEHDYSDNEVVYEDISEQHVSPGANHSGKSDDKDDDYAFPVDAVNEDKEPNIYENPIHPSEQSDDNNSAPGPVISIRSQRLSDSNMRYGGDGAKNSGSDNVIRTSVVEPAVINKRKLSLGVIFRKISTGSAHGSKRKTSLQERRLSSAFTKLITLPMFVKNTLGESYQVDSSSWEFLNRDVEDECWKEKVNKNDKHNNKDDKGKETQLTSNKHPSKDSLYESEYDSSSTMGSSSSSSSKVSSLESSRMLFQLTNS